MPPVGVAPLVLTVVGAVASFRLGGAAKLALFCSAGIVLGVQVGSYARMISEVLVERRMGVAVVRIVEQLGIVAQVGGDARLIAEELIK
jgi:hypothetical protein